MITREAKQKGYLWLEGPGLERVPQRVVKDARTVPAGRRQVNCASWQWQNQLIITDGDGAVCMEKSHTLPDTNIYLQD